MCVSTFSNLENIINYASFDSDAFAGENEVGCNIERFGIEAFEKCIGESLNVLVKQVSIMPL